MPVKYRFDVLEALKNAGYTTYKMRCEKTFAEGTIQAFRRGEVVGPDNIGRICRLLHCQPGDLLEYVEDEDGVK